jgi:hypothetical protein
MCTHQHDQQYVDGCLVCCGCGSVLSVGLFCDEGDSARSHAPLPTRARPTHGPSYDRSRYFLRWTRKHRKLPENEDYNSVTREYRSFASHFNRTVCVDTTRQYIPSSCFLFERICLDVLGLPCFAPCSVKSQAVVAMYQGWWNEYLNSCSPLG